MHDGDAVHESLHFPWISRRELAYDAKPGSPENETREPRPKAGVLLFRDSGSSSEMDPTSPAYPAVGGTLPYAGDDLEEPLA